MSMAFVTGAVLPRSGLAAGTTAVSAEPARFAAATTTIFSPLEIYASKHAQLKAAKKANRLRPKKHRPSDINRAPPKYHPEPHLINGPTPYYTVLDEAAIAALEEELANAEPGTVFTADTVKAIELEKAEKEAKEAAELSEKRRVARTQSKRDKVTAKNAKSTAHAAHKVARAERIRAMIADFPNSPQAKYFTFDGRSPFVTKDSVTVDMAAGLADAVVEARPVIDEDVVDDEIIADSENTVDPEHNADLDVESVEIPDSGDVSQEQ